MNTFESYKNRLIYEGGEHHDIRYNVIQYLCSFPGINPDEMAAALLHEGRNVLFNDGSISAAQNAANQRRVATMVKHLVRAYGSADAIVAASNKYLQIGSAKSM